MKMRSLQNKKHQIKHAKKLARKRVCKHLKLSYTESLFFTKRTKIKPLIFQYTSRSVKFQCFNRQPVDPTSCPRMMKSRNFIEKVENRFTWIFMATGRPSGRTARWTCPIDAAANGFGSNSVNFSFQFGPRSLLTTFWNRNIYSGYQMQVHVKRCKM